MRVIIIVFVILDAIIFFRLAGGRANFDSNPPAPAGTHWHKRQGLTELICDKDGQEIGSATYALNEAFVWQPFIPRREKFENIHQAKRYVADHARCAEGGIR